MSADPYLGLMEGCGGIDDQLQPSAARFLPAVSSTSLHSATDSEASVFGSLDLPFNEATPASSQSKSPLDFLHLGNLDLGRTELLPNDSQRVANSTLGSGVLSLSREENFLLSGFQENSGRSLAQNQPFRVASSSTSPLDQILPSDVWCSHTGPNPLPHSHSSSSILHVPATSANPGFQQALSSQSHAYASQTQLQGHSASSSHCETVSVSRESQTSPIGRICKACGKEIQRGSPSQHFENVSYHQTCCICSICRHRAAIGQRMRMIGDALCCQSTELCSSRREQAQMASAALQSSPTRMNLPPSAKAIGQQQMQMTSQKGESQSAEQHMVDIYPPFQCQSRGAGGGDAQLSVSDASSPDSVNSKDFSILDLTKNHDSPEDQQVGSSCGGRAGHAAADQNKPRGPRTQIKPKQLTILTALFDRNPKPSRQAQEQAARETGLTKRVVQVWFQNKRSKEKRIRQMQMPFADFAYMNYGGDGNYFLPRADPRTQYGQQQNSGMPFYEGHQSNTLKVSNPMLQTSEQCQSAAMPAKQLVHPASIPPTNDGHLSMRIVQGRSAAASNTFSGQQQSMFHHSQLSGGLSSLADRPTFGGKIA